VLEATLALRIGTLDLDVALEAAAGDAVALLGPNGAGKTTFLRALAGLVRLTRGEIRLDGTVLDDTARGVHVPTERRPIGLVFQDHLLFPHLTVLENVAFGLRARGRGRAALDLARAWLDRVELGELAAVKPAALSGGQAQRVALARSLATNPRLLLLDEPLAALDATTRATVRRELRRQLSSFTGVHILVTHDPLEAMAFADRLVILEAGRILQSGSVAEVAQRPRSRYVADLVGVNFLRGHGHDGRVDLDGGGTLAIPEAVNGPVFATIHPRAVALHRARPDGSPRNVWRGRIGPLDVQADRARVRIDGTPPIVAEVTPAAIQDLDLAAGGLVWVSVKATEIGVYPS